MESRRRVDFTRTYRTRKIRRISRSEQPLVRVGRVLCEWSYGISFSGGSFGIAAVANTHHSVAAVLEGGHVPAEAMVRRIACADRLPVTD